MKNEKPLALVVGGSSGLGLELALCLTKTHRVVITGRKYVGTGISTFFVLDLKDDPITSFKRLNELVELFPLIDIVVYAAGFGQFGTIAQLSDEDILKMFNVGGIAPTILLQKILKRQGFLENFIAITSTSQWTPRPEESVYTEVKAGLAMFAKSISFDRAIGKVMVAAPAGMKTGFYKNDGRDMSTFLDPSWVAENILKHYAKLFKYHFIKILRDPPRVEPGEIRYL